jgi:hypothetical protein
MGFRFNLQAANWVAALLDVESDTFPEELNTPEGREALRDIGEKFERNFFSNIRKDKYLRRDIEDLYYHLMKHPFNIDSKHTLRDLFKIVHGRIGFTPWKALIIPSTDSNDETSFISTRDFLRELVTVNEEDPGIILQLEEWPKNGEYASITNVFPAFKSALSRMPEWPGILIWRKATESIFLPFRSRSKSDVMDRSLWIFRHLATSLDPNLGELEKQYYIQFDLNKDAHLFHIFHISDLHIGSIEATRRIERVLQIIDNLYTEFPAHPVSSGMRLSESWFVSQTTA